MGHCRLLGESTSRSVNPSDLAGGALITRSATTPQELGQRR